MSGYTHESGNHYSTILESKAMSNPKEAQSNVSVDNLVDYHRKLRRTLQIVGVQIQMKCHLHELKCFYMLHEIICYCVQSTGV